MANFDWTLVLKVLQELVANHPRLTFPRIEAHLERCQANEFISDVIECSDMQLSCFAHNIRRFAGFDSLGEGIKSLYEDFLLASADVYFNNLIAELPVTQTVNLTAYFDGKKPLNACRIEFGTIVNTAFKHDWALKDELFDLYTAIYEPRPVLPVQKLAYSFVSRENIAQATLRTIEEGNSCPLCRQDNAKGFYLNADQWIRCLHCLAADEKPKLQPQTLTEKQKNQYLEHPQTCPYCQSEELSSLTPLTHPDDFDGEYRQQIKCGNCLKMWWDCYTLTGLVEV